MSYNCLIRQNRFAILANRYIGIFIDRLLVRAPRNDRADNVGSFMIERALQRQRNL